MMRRRRAEEDTGDNWLTTYSDMVTLLLCFFVLLYTFSTLDVQRFKSVLASFQGGSGMLDGSDTIIPEELNLIKAEDDLTSLKDILENYAMISNLEEEITISIEERGLIIRFMDRVLFDPGKADIKPEAYDILDSIAEILNSEEFGNRLIKVEGHADTTPVNPADGFPTNWELSAIRATNVLRYLVEEKNIDGSRISSSGYSFYRPIAPNDTKENKAKNRRVDIVILNSIQEKTEP
ncbi:MAG: flagellar motor protein MotB [Tissierellia bacterium]|nr:flagellar motor protein MotB [Tissierellia bacterium]